MTRDKDCIFFRNAIAVIDSIIVTLEDYLFLNPDQKREKFLEEVEVLNCSEIPARLLVNPNKYNVVMHRKAMALRIRSVYQSEPIYRFNKFFNASKLFLKDLKPEMLILLFERYINFSLEEVKNLILKKENCGHINLLLANKLFSVVHSDEIRFNEFIGVNNVSFEACITQFYNKSISRLNMSSVIPLLYDSKDIQEINVSLKKILELQKRKLQQPGGFRSKKRF